MRIYGFAPVEEKDAVLLIVGSMPSVMSLKDDFYYAHRQNAFWPMMAKIFSAPVPETKEEKKHLLLEHKIALWDVYASCVREGSLDSAIRAGEKNDFDVFFKAIPISAPCSATERRPTTHLAKMPPCPFCACLQPARRIP